MVETQTDHADVKIHPPILTLLHVTTALLLSWMFPFPVSLSQIFKIAGVVLVLAGLTQAFLAVRQFNRAHTTLDPHGQVRALVTGGPYRFSRNPIYLGFVLILAGFPLFSGTVWGAILVPVLILNLNNLVIQHEEAYLEKKFGEAYAGYRSRVRRWL